VEFKSRQLVHFSCGKSILLIIVIFVSVIANFSEYGQTQDDNVHAG